MQKPPSKFSILHSKFSLFIILFSSFFILFVALAFDNPTSSPPTGGGYLQTQSGQLLITKPTKVTSGNNFIVENGNVGIGTTNPTQKLEVAGNANITGNFIYLGGNGFWFQDATNSVFQLPSGGGNWQFKDPAGIVKAIIDDNGNSYFMGGNVGIGTTNPITKLHIAGGDIEQSDGTSGFLMHSRAFAGYDFWQLAPKTSGAYEWGKGITLVRSTGNVGIGTTAPGAKLELANIGTQPVIKWTASGGRTYGIEPYDNRFILADLGVRRILEADPAGWTTLWGNVGIGTTAPGAGLEINRGATNNLALLLNSSGAGWGSGLWLKNTATGAKTYGIYSGSDAKLHFTDVDNGVDRIVIDSSGNVGIGTTTPQYKLDVVDFIRIKPSAANIGDFGLLVDALPGTNPKLVVFSDNPASIETLNWDLTIRTNVNGTTYDGAIYLRPRAAASTGAGGVFIINDSNVLANNQPIFRITDLTSHRLVVTRAGNVGIGTTTPGYKLDVVGNIRTTGCLVYNGGTLGTCVSEEQLKNVIGSFQIDNALSKIIQLKPVKYTFKFDPAQQVLIGLLAEETEKIASELIEIKDGQKQIKYGELQWMQIEAIKELNNKIKELQKEIDDLKAQLTSLK